MRVPVYFAILVAAAPLIVAQTPADAAWELTLRLSQVRRQTANAINNQPDYTCLATFDRYRQAINEPAERKMDTVRVEVAYVSGSELYSWPGEGKFSDKPLTSMVGAGLMGDGDFAVHAHNVFVSNNATEKYAGEEPDNGLWRVTGRKLWRWDFSISSYQSGWTIQHSGAKQIVGSEGSFWVDTKTLDLVRMETRATDFLAGFPLKSVTSVVEYGRVHIGDNDVLLPLRAALKTVATDGTESRNATEYTDCRQYAGQSTITFGALPEPAPDVPAVPAAQEKVLDSRLPRGLALKIRLAGDLALGRATVGEAIEGTLAAPLLNGKGEVAPKGAAVHGRVRYLAGDTTAGRIPGAPERYTELGLVFDELEFSGRVYHFTALLKSFDTPVPGVRDTIIRDRSSTVDTMTREAIMPARVPGVSVFFIDTRGSGLPKGTLMTWISQ